MSISFTIQSTHLKVLEEEEIKSKAFGIKS